MVRIVTQTALFDPDFPKFEDFLSSLESLTSDDRDALRALVQGDARKATLSIDDGSDFVGRVFILQTAAGSWVAKTLQLKQKRKRETSPKDAPYQLSCVATSKRFFQQLKEEVPDKDWAEFYERNSKKFKSDDLVKKQAREAKAAVEAEVETNESGEESGEESGDDYESDSEPSPKKATTSQ